jgi:hypothetical protein
MATAQQIHSLHQTNGISQAMEFYRTGKIIPRDYQRLPQTCNDCNNKCAGVQLFADVFYYFNSEDQKLPSDFLHAARQIVRDCPFGTHLTCRDKIKTDAIKLGLELYDLNISPCEVLHGDSYDELYAIINDDIPFDDGHNDDIHKKNKHFLEVASNRWNISHCSSHKKDRTHSTRRKAHCKLYKNKSRVTDFSLV